MSKPKRKICYNCIFAGAKFKLGTKTHLHCFRPKEDGQDPYDTLREFSETCKDFSEKKQGVGHENT